MDIPVDAFLNEPGYCSVQDGTSGTGKTGLAIGLARKALLDGYRVRFYNAQDNLDGLFASLADRSTSRVLKSMASYDLLVIDELGYLSLKPEQVKAFFKLTEMRYGNKATIITTNLDYEKWYQLFNRKPLVDAFLDRLRHHCITIKVLRSWWLRMGRFRYTHHRGSRPPNFTKKEPISFRDTT
ncbi:ATP-binding protein [Sulfidibacter corallicola]|uniref:ATP-binding protein n=1 Tax=Sulfidibacter corallicola TaxID=2818388 RepID=A0A8A4TMI9_SULCO|nr:ATP-binding protein [Sulfidibacter corallicola]QTD51199.1 ATP-binding protein [Sulfidibacter corallicola]